MAGQEGQTERELSSSFKRIGRLLSENMGLGIAEGTDEAKTASDQLYQELLDSQTKYMQEKERLENAIEAAEEAQAQRNYQNRLKRAKSAAQVQTVQQNEQLRLQKKANDEYIDALETHLKFVEERIRAQRERITDEFDQIAKKAADSLEDLEKAREKMAEKMVDYGGLYQSKRQIFLNAGPNGEREIYENAILDLSRERVELEKYASLLREIGMQEDIPSEMFQSIRELSIEDAIRYQEALLTLSDAERAAYIEDWKAIQNLAEQTAKDSFVKDTKLALDAIEGELENWYGTIPSGFFQEGTLSAEAFGAGFIESLANMQEMLQQAVSEVISGEGFLLQSGNSQTENTVRTNNYTTTYVLNGAGETVSQQLRSARAHEAVVQLREG
ncbi:MAG: hypothetical protein E7393_04835 [Ruminococcaceae bacterium]|nr:hypothetical protein [Oscillospiraceae bacterium]